MPELKKIDIETIAQINLLFKKGRKINLKEILCFLIIIMTLSQPNRASGQKNELSNTQTDIEQSISSDILFSHIVASRTDGTTVNGFLIGVKRDTLFISAKENIKINLKDLSTAGLEVEKISGRSILTGMVLGSYLTSLLLYSQKHNSALFIKDLPSSIGFWFVEIIGAFLGGGLVYLNPVSKVTFNFTGSETEKLLEWEKFKRYVKGASFYIKDTNVKFSIQTGWINTSSLNALRDAGYKRDEYSNNPGNFNLLRKMQLTFTYGNDMEYGAAMMWIGEPSRKGYYPDQFSQSYKATGYYFVGIYKPLISKMPLNTDWNIGVGVGLANIDFKRKIDSYSGPPDYQAEHYEYKISKSVYSADLFSDLNYRISNGFSLGLAVDYAFFPGEQIPAIPAENIKAYQLQGNFCAGFILGLHF